MRCPPPHGLPPAQGLYDPAFEHDACGMGFVASIRGHKSHDIIKQGIQVLINLTHRGACGCDPGNRRRRRNPDSDSRTSFSSKKQSCLALNCRKPGEYAVGMTFLPVEKHQRLQCEGILERIAGEEGLSVAGLARHAGGRRRHRTRGPPVAALHSAGVRRTRRRHGRRPFRAQAVCGAQTRRARGSRV